jgi:hypothetical protein
LNGAGNKTSRISVSGSTISQHNFTVSKRALTTKPIERAHVPIKDRLRSMRGLGSVETGQLLLEGIELAQAVQRGDVRPPHQHTPGSVHERSRFEAATFSWLASGLRTAA